MTNKTVITLPEMVDLALSGPEVGAVNFNILHALLHILIQQMQQNDTQIQFKDDLTERFHNLLKDSKQKTSSVHLIDSVVIQTSENKLTDKNQTIKTAEFEVYTSRLQNLEEQFLRLQQQVDDLNSGKIGVKKYISKEQEECEILDNYNSAIDKDSLADDNVSDTNEDQKICDRSSGHASCLDEKLIETSNDFANIQLKFVDINKQMHLIEMNIKSEMESLKNHIAEMTDQNLNIRIRPSENNSITSNMNDKTFLDLRNKYQQLQKDMASIGELFNEIKNDKMEHEQSIGIVIEQVETLKRMKVDRKDLDDALGDKADVCLINRKVSHETFENICDQFNRNIEEAFIKISEQELNWQQVLTGFKKEIGNKLEKKDMESIANVFNTKLKTFQDDLKQFTNVKSEREASGVNSKYLKNVNCISCDTDAILSKKMEPKHQPLAPIAQPATNLAPFLTYKLDALRKEQLQGKNLNKLENALKTYANEKSRFCNRFCGGSHTTQSIQKRCLKSGSNQMDQCEENFKRMSEHLIRGTDKQMYRGEEDEIELPKRPSFNNNTNLTSTPHIINTCNCSENQ